MCNCDCCPKREVVSKKKLSAALNAVFNQYPNVRMNLPAVINLMMRELDLPMDDWKRGNSSALAFIHEEVQKGTYSLLRGPKGGLTRVAPIGLQIHTAVNQEGESTVVNNHVCPTCGNNRVNKDERSCWKCGGAL